MYRGHEMRILLNGEEREVAAGLTLSGLVELLGSKPDRVAIELNHAIVPRDRWPATELKERDQLEVVHFVGGGTGSLRRCKR
jgi:thiamine biosynthesis protein ThiS